jgi:hypothetical protein
MSRGKVMTAIRRLEGKPRKPGLEAECNRACDICGSTAWNLTYQIPDRSPLGLEIIRIGECSGCSHRFLVDPPIDLLRNFYAQDEDCYAFHVSDSYAARAGTHSRRVLELIWRYAHQGKLLEIGCGSGMLLDVARGFSFQTFGVEPSRWQADLVGRKGHTVFNSTFEQAFFDNEVFDVFVGIESIEHILSLPEFMQRLNDISRPGAVVYFSTGSTASLKAMLNGERWRYYEALHTQYFCPKSIRRLMENWGWNVLEIGSGYRLVDVLRYGLRDYTAVDMVKKCIGRVRFGTLTVSGVHVVARKLS